MSLRERKKGYIRREYKIVHLKLNDNSEALIQKTMSRDAREKRKNESKEQQNNK